MYMQVISIEHSLERPRVELGDAALSPIFHRVPARCPVLHLFGYVSIPSDLASAALGTSALIASIESCQMNGCLPERRSGCETDRRVAPTSDALPHEASRGTTPCPGGVAPLLSRLSGTPDGVQRNLAFPSPKRVVHALGHEGRHRTANTAEVTAQHVAPSSSPLLFSRTSHADQGAIGGDGHPQIFTDKTIRSSTAWSGRYTQRRACLHVHGVYPSLLLPQYDRNVSADQLAAQLETVSLRVLARQGTVVPSQQLVHNVRLVRRINVYGYHPRAHIFYEVELIDPDLLPKVVDILQNSTELGGRQWQLYNAHYPYHTQFMVRWRVNGVAPFLLPTRQCHVRLPTVFELSEGTSVFPALLGSAGEAPACFHGCIGGGSAVARRSLNVEEEEEEEEERKKSAARSAQHSQLPFNRWWRPDELGRFTTAEVELDVAGDDLLDHASKIEKGGARGAAALIKGSRKVVEAGDNLSHTRRVIRDYFKVHGVADALRLADTISMECHLSERARIAVAVPREPCLLPTSAEEAESVSEWREREQRQQQQRRYGCVMQIQRGDPTVRWLRHRMLAYLSERAKANPAVAESLLAPSFLVCETGDGGEASPSKGLIETGAAATAASPVASTPFLFGSASPLQEQRAIRQQLVAEYCKPGSSTGMSSGHGHRHRGTDVRTIRAHTDDRVVIPPFFARVTDPGPPVTRYDPLYVGCTSESLQLSASQGQADPQRPPSATARENTAIQLSPSSSSFLTFFDTLSPTVRAGAVAAPTQDLLAALARTSTPSLPSQGNRPALFVAAAETTAPQCSLVGSQEANKTHSGDVQVGEEAIGDLVGNPGVTLAAPAAATLTRRGSSSSWFSWSSRSRSTSSSSSSSSSSLLSVTAALSSGEASPNRRRSSPSLHKDSEPSSLHSSVPQACERTREKPCTAPFDAAAIVSNEPSQRPMRPSLSGSRRGSNAQGSGPPSDALSSADSEAIVPSVAASQEDGSLLPLGSTDSDAALDELAVAEVECTPEARRRCASSSSTASPVAVVSALRLPPFAAHGFAEGDCMAFVSVRSVASGHLGEVLAVARIAALTSEAAQLQWLLRLSETHLAVEEHVLVRRGSWLRAQLPSLEKVSHTVSPTKACHGHSAAGVLNVHLGELLLGNVCDRVTISALEVGARAAIAYATASSSTTQWRSTGKAAPSRAPALHTGGIGVAAQKAEPEVSKVAPPSGWRCGSDDAVHEVQVWRAHCFTDVAAYYSVARPPDELHWLHAGHSSCSPLPTLRILCRYAYDVEARVLTGISPDVFAPRVSVPAMDGSSEPDSQPISFCSEQRLRCGKQTASTAPAGRPSRARASSSRVLFTQPQPLPPLGNSPVHSRTAAASLNSASVPLFLPSASPETSDAAPGKESSDDGGEDRLLFPSKSPSSGTTTSESRGLTQRREDVTTPYVTHSGSQGLGSMLRWSPPRGTSGVTGGARLTSSDATHRPHDAANSFALSVVKGLWRVVLARTSPGYFSVGPIRVSRSVKAFGHPGTDTLISQEQARRRRRGPSWSTDGNGSTTIDVTTAGPSEVASVPRKRGFSDATGVMDGDGDEDQSVSATVGDGSAADVSLSVDTAVSPWGREADVVVVGSVVSCGEHSRSAGPLTSLTVSSLTASPSSSLSVNAVREVTASQRGFLELLKAGRNLGEMDVHSVLLQLRGQLGCMVDGMARSFLVSATGRDGALRSGGGGCGGGGLRVHVSAVAWPWTAPPGVARKDDALVLPQYERVTPFSVAPVSVAGVSHVASAVSTAACATSTGRGAENPPQESIKSRKSAGHIYSLSPPATEHPQHYLQCTLRVLYIEVLLHRRPGEVLASTSEVLAVGLGQATTATSSGIAIRLFCVAAPKHRSTASTAPHASTASCALGSPQLAVRDAPPLVGLTEAVQVVTVPDEAALLARVRDEILAYDPDILISWDGFKYGLGYLTLRYRAVFQRDLALDLSRVLQHHSFHRPHASGVPYSRSAASASSEDAGGKGGAAGYPSSSRTKEGSAEALRGNARAGGLPRKRSRSPPPASRATAFFTAGNDGNETVPAPVGLQGVATMAVRPSAPSSAVSPAPSAALIIDSDQDDDNDDGNSGSGNSVSSNGDVRRRCRGALDGQASEDGREGDIRWAHRGSRWNREPQAPLAAAQYSKRFGANVHVVGRICRSLGKDLRKDIKMPSYSLSMVHVELLGQPLPYFADSYLAELFLQPPCPDVLSGGERHTALRYLASRVAAPHRIACKLRWFTKLLEFSQMYGILTNEVLTRGSQFRVEATLLRLAEPLGYAMLSPSLSQVHRQPRIECIPLVMQPKVDLYRHDPVVVLDFRSLYPSIIIAYNLCYSTCLGMVQPHSRGRLGVLSRFKQSDAALMELLPDDGAQHDGVVFTPNGAMFVSPSTRAGLLPQMMRAVLDARFEVQAALKHIAAPSEDVAMAQRLEEQQLALKMLANVTYGYTAASYTGRMPCVDLAEAIVSLGRQTLERAVALIHGTPTWRADVVYGDTDSLFVRLAGRTKAEAFRIGQEMADAVTQSNPAPIRLQFEKVLLPCLLLTKKRYAGYMWRAPTQTTPIFLAKGIEVVRRDQCPATAQLACQLLRQLFDGADVAALRRSYYTAVERLQAGTVNPIQCIFRRGVKLGRYQDSGDAHLPLGARLALQQMEKDVMQTPYWGERLPYVVVRSTTSLKKLSDQVLYPERLLYAHDTTHSLDATYYIVRHINSTLDRMFYLIGISFSQWYQTMPRRRAAHAALLSLPTFMAAQLQHQQQQERKPPPPPPPPRQQDAVPVDAVGAVLLSFSVDTANILLSPRSRQMRLRKLTALMEELLLQQSTSGLLSAFSRGDASAGATRAIAPEEISDGDGQSDEAVQPTDVDDLTRVSIHEVVDVEQFVTQRSDRPPSTVTETTSPPPDSFPCRGQVASRFGRRQRWRTATIDSFYPRTLCVVCEEEAVRLEDISRHRAALMQVGIVGCDTEAGGVSSPSSSVTSCAATASTAHRPHPFLLPPICTRCWSDPLLLHLRVQQQCSSFSRQMNALQRLCGRCISSGGSAGDAAAAAYKRAIADMEDMDAFCMSSTLMRPPEFPRSTWTGVDGSIPRHVLAAVELSAEGVPHGCVSVDCAVGFQKKWVTAQWTQWQVLQTFLSRVL
ncbi:hypothetical protein JKF63_04914 [Porcisia hertigi]|uniref:DNA-directed DNA polymerase n=1 Tax=Porcisia hertigi TaxID=2761500 RepID=A0A836HRD4_9TRYP|nr:hypothetical protein JKF63_04914 [Porcisia hertigi]